MHLSSYSSSFFCVEINGELKNFSPNQTQKQILAEILATDTERFWDNPEYCVHALYHSAPKYEHEMGGYEYGELLSEWAKDKPQVKKFGFDDEAFMSSVGFLIPAMSKWESMGVNVVLCPQSGEPFDFFCYPSHLKSLFKAFGAAETELLSVPARDASSPLFFKTEELKKRLLESVKDS